MIQGLWEYKSPFLQLPFVTDDHLRMFATKKRHIKNLQQFAQLKPEESRHILKHLSDFEYEQVMRVLGKMPIIDFSIRCEGRSFVSPTSTEALDEEFSHQFSSFLQLSMTRTRML